MNEEQIKEAIADKIEDAIWDNIDEGTFSYGSNTGAIVSDMAKASAAAVMALVKPKPLVWAVEIYTATIGHRAECYIITQSKNGGVCFLSSGHPHDIGALKYPTIEAAQAAAQSHADAVHWANTNLSGVLKG